MEHQVECPQCQTLVEALIREKKTLGIFHQYLVECKTCQLQFESYDFAGNVVMQDKPDNPGQPV